MKRALVTVLLLAGIVVTLVASLWFGQANQEADAESFGGTDAQVTDMLDAQGAEPWFTPIFQPESSELESGLFTAQAGLGGIVLGYCIGRLQGRRRSEQDTPGDVYTTGAHSGNRA